MWGPSQQAEAGVVGPLGGGVQPQELSLMHCSPVWAQSEE